MRIAFALPGLHRVPRGAEVAFESVAAELAKLPETEVTLFGSGHPSPDSPYRFIHVPCLPREHFFSFPKIPVLRNEYAWEELTFLPGFLSRYAPTDFDITVACSYPHMNWVLRGRKSLGGYAPKHIFVTQNGDHAARTRSREFRWFGCDGLVCTNPDYYRDNAPLWNSCLIPNGVDPERFHPGTGERARFEIPENTPVVLMVSALIESKRVLAGIEAVAGLPDTHLVICGSGPEHPLIEAKARELLPGRFQLLSLPRDAMPAMYRSADTFLHMSLDEPSANSYIEALATGLPIVTHDRAVTRWTLENTSFLVDATDIPAVTKRLREALESPSSDINARRELVQRRFTWKSIARQYHDFFSKILSE